MSVSTTHTHTHTPTHTHTYIRTEVILRNQVCAWFKKVLSLIKAQEYDGNTSTCLKVNISKHT